jgi:hypothetical protein
MSTFKCGDLIKSGRRVFEVHGITKGNTNIPDGWLIDNTGSFTNPVFCEKYMGATSCFPQHTICKR